MTQCEKVLKYMMDFGSISTYSAFLDLKVTRLASRIHDLKRQGYKITSKTIVTKNIYGETTHYSEYALAEGKEN